MPPTARERLEHIAQSIETIYAYTTGKTLTDYERDPMLRDAVERRFTIITEAMLALDEMSSDPTMEGISSYRRIIGFRIILTHRYYELDSRLVWQNVQYELPRLHEEVKGLLESA